MFEWTDAKRIDMHAGDTGSKWIHATRESGEDWTSADRCLFTVTNQNNEIVMQRIYRLDDQWGAGNGWFLMEFHNEETDTWAQGDYGTEWRYDVDPTWEGTPPTSRCANALAIEAKMTNGAIVRTKVQGTLHINGVRGFI